MAATITAAGLDGAYWLRCADQDEAMAIQATAEVIHQRRAEEMKKIEEKN